MIFSHEERKFVWRSKTNKREVEVVKHFAIRGGAVGQRHFSLSNSNLIKAPMSDEA